MNGSQVGINAVLASSSELLPTTAKILLGYVTVVYQFQINTSWTNLWKILFLKFVQILHLMKLLINVNMCMCYKNYCSTSQMPHAATLLRSFSTFRYGNARIVYVIINYYTTSSIDLLFERLLARVYYYDTDFSRLMRGSLHKLDVPLQV